MRFLVTGFFCLLATYSLKSFGQTGSDSLGNALNSCEKYVHSLDDRSQILSSDVNKQTAKYLDQLKSEEAAMQKQLARIDSGAAKRIFAKSQQQYDKL